MRKPLSILTFFLITILSFAQTPIFYDSFNNNKGIGGNDGKWSRFSSTTPAYFMDAGWSATAYAYSASNCIRIGNTNDTNGYITSPPIKMKGKGLLTFSVGCWNTASEKENMSISMEGATIIPNEQVKEDGSIAIIKSQWKNVRVMFETNEDAENIRISFHQAKTGLARFFLDELKVYAVDLPIQISHLGYSTLFTNQPYQLPAGLSAYKVTPNDAGANIKIVPLNLQTIPKNTAVLLKGNPGSYPTELLLNSSEPITDNLLQGVSINDSIVPKQPENQIYVLNTGSNGVGFYWQRDEGKYAKVAAWRCYLEINIPQESASQGLSLSEELPTVIPQSLKEESTSPLYDITGRRIRSPKNGLYIINGKKVIL